MLRPLACRAAMHCRQSASMVIYLHRMRNLFRFCQGMGNFRGLPPFAAPKPLQALKRKAAAWNASFKKLFSYLVADVRIRSDNSMKAMRMLIVQFQQKQCLQTLALSNTCRKMMQPWLQRAGELMLVQLEVDFGQDN